MIRGLKCEKLASCNLWACVKLVIQQENFSKDIAFCRAVGYQLRGTEPLLCAGVLLTGLWENVSGSLMADSNVHA